MSEARGNCSEQFAPLRDMFEANLASGEELGASVAVVQDGDLVVDLWGGWADLDHGGRWARDTITTTWSVTKTMTALTALVLVERGDLDVYSPVGKYWPEFASNGKAQIEIRRHLLSHTSGVSGWEPPFDPAVVYDWDRATPLLAAQAPWWQPGTASGYHKTSYGHLVGEVVRWITGRSIGRIFAEEIAGPLEADFQIGLPADDFARVSNVVFPGYPFAADPEAEPVDPDSVAAKTAGPPFDEVAAAASQDWRRVEIPSGNGHGNARAVARIQSLVSHDGWVVDGVRLLSPATIDLIFDQQSDGVDLVAGVPVRFGIGYALPDPDLAPFISAGRRCFWFGWGGAIVVNDLERRLTFAYVMNQWLRLCAPSLECDHEHRVLSPDGTRVTVDISLQDAARAPLKPDRRNQRVRRAAERTEATEAMRQGRASPTDPFSVPLGQAVANPESRREVSQAARLGAGRSHRSCRLSSGVASHRAIARASLKPSVIAPVTAMTPSTNPRS